jgi:hypothetical protein
MGVAEWLLVAAIVCVFAFIILRPDRWGKRDDATAAKAASTRPTAGTMTMTGEMAATDGRESGKGCCATGRRRRSRGQVRLTCRRT